jgi:hypothetical protein
MCFGCPNQGRRCAYILVVDPGYSRVRKETLLTLAAPAFPSFWEMKLSAALVLFPVSADNVVLGTMPRAEQNPAFKMTMRPILRRKRMLETRP